MPNGDEVQLITAPIFNRANSRTVADLTPSLSMTMGAAFDEAMIHNPVPALNRMLTLNRRAELTGGVSGVMPNRTLFSMFSDIVVSGVTGDPLPGDESPETLAALRENGLWMTPQRAEIFINKHGFSISDIPISPDGVNVLVLDAVLMGKIGERNRQQILQQGGDGRFPAILMASLAGTVIDPLNIGSAFIPFAGVARYRQALSAVETAGQRALVRMKFGVIEGMAGAAVVEPFPLLAASQDLLDYGIDDTLSNIAFGAVLGGGMHMGIGWTADVIRGIRTRGGITLDPEPHGVMGELQNQLSTEQLEANVMHTLIAAARDRNLMADELMESLQGRLEPGARIELPDDLVLRINDAGEAGLFSRTGAAETILSLLDRKDLSPRVRAILEDSSDAKSAATKLAALIDQEERIDIRNVQDLQKVLTKEEAVPLSTFLEREGGLRADEIIDELGINTANRPNLFNREGGLTLKEALKRAKDAGFIPRNIGKREAFLRLLERDLAGNRIFTPEAEAKLAPFREQAAELRDINAVRKALDDQAASQLDLIGFSERFESNENLNSFNAERIRQEDEILSRSVDETDVAEVQKQTDDLTSVIEQNEKALGFEDATLRAEVDKIDVAIDRDINIRKMAVDCLLGVAV